MKKPKSKQQSFHNHNNRASRKYRTLESMDRIRQTRPQVPTHYSLPPSPRKVPGWPNRRKHLLAPTLVAQVPKLQFPRILKDGLGKGFKNMTSIQRASLPHALCGRDILGAAKTGSGKSLAFIIPVFEKLYKARWGPEDGVGSIILSPTRELADQLFGVLKSVGKHHGFTAGLLIGGNEYDEEKDLVNVLNILICTP
ncbi:DEAD-box ATP-dependent RNA helicase 32, partial [Tanacetum coccineum]